MPSSDTSKNSLSFLNFFHLAFTVVAIVLLTASAGIIGSKVVQDATAMTRPLFVTECERGSPGGDCILNVTAVVTSVRESTKEGETQEDITVAVVPEDQEAERQFVNGFLNVNIQHDSRIAKEDTLQAIAIDRDVYFLITESGDYVYGTDFSGVRVAVGLYAVAIVAAMGALMGLGYVLRRRREQGWNRVAAGQIVSASSRSFAFGWSIIAFTVLSSVGVLVAFEADLISPDMAMPGAMLGTVAGALCSIIAIRWQQGHDTIEPAEPEPEPEQAPTLGSRLREQL